MIARTKRVMIGFGRDGAVIGSALPLMLATVLMFGAFMVWLNKASEPALVELVEEEAPEEVVPMAREVALASYAADPTSFAGSVIRLSGISVNSVPAGTTGMFWVQEGGLLLFHVNDPSVVMDSAISAGETLSVTGTVSELTDEVIAAWLASGRAVDDALLELGFASEFFTIEVLERAGNPGLPGSGG